MRHVAILGATGSIGGSALDVIARHPDRFRAVALTCRSDVATLIERCVALRPDYAAIADPALERTLVDGLRAAGLSTRVLAGADAATQVATLPEVDTVLAAIVGAAGLQSTL